jgi:diacylglycerol kinase (ATP)
MVSVGNSTTYGGGMQIVPHARLDDGRLDVCIIGAVSRLRFVANFPKVFAGRHADVPGVEFARGSQITVESLGPSTDGAPLEVWADGERVAPLPATMTVVRDALVVRVPR